MTLLDHLAERRSAAINVGLGSVFAAMLVIEGAALARTGGDWWFDCAVATALCVVTLLRGQNPAWPAAAGLAIAGAAQLAARLGYPPGHPHPDEGVTTLALLVLGGAVIRRLPVRQAAIIWAAGLAVLVGEGITIGPGPVGGPTSVTMWSAALGTGLWLRLRDARRESAIHRHEATVESVRRDERLLLARELHDATAHHVTGIVLQTQAVRITARRNTDGLDDALAAIESVGTEALTSMRQVIGLLRDADDGAGVTPGPEQLTDLVHRFTDRGGPAVRLSLPNDSDGSAWPPEVTGTVYRVVAEALTNVVRHAPDAHQVTVAVADDRRAITVEITDDAPPAGMRQFPHASGYGLVGMRERVEALGGTLSAGPCADAGWSVLATLPAPGTP